MNAKKFPVSRQVNPKHSWPMPNLSYIFNKQNDKALATAKEELCSLFPRFPQVLDASYNLPNVDYALLLSYAVYECRFGNLKRGLSILDEISSRVKFLLSDSRYDSEGKKIFGQVCGVALFTINSVFQIIPLRKCLMK